MLYTGEKLNPITFKYLPAGLDITDYDAVSACFDDLASRKPANKDDLLELLRVHSDLLKAMADELSWRYVRMTLNADNDAFEQAYNDYFAKAQAANEEKQFQIKQIYYNSPYRKELPEAEFALLDQIMVNEISLYREENIPLMVQESELANKYGGIVSQMSAPFDGEDRTVAQLAVYLKDPERSKREAAWRLRVGLFVDKAAELDALYDEMKSLRHQLALNAGFSNYRDYKHQEMGRFSYTPEELYAFHDAVEKVVIPFVKEKDEHRRQCLGLKQLRPWDLSVDLDGRKLQPFETTDEFIQKSLKVLNKVHPDYARQLEMMQNTGLLDLENRKGKAPGGYNTSINNLASSFIFMNHVKLHNDVVTLLHESGHAMHSAATRNIPWAQYLETPSEVAELASMTMELLTMDYWDEFYPTTSDLKKAKRDQLEGTLSFLPWCMTVDAFQHWVYLHPEARGEEHNDAYLQITQRFNTLTDWSGLEAMRRHMWKQQLHIFEVPFYYIEYGMAQLGALSIYMNYRQDKAKALQQFQAFMELGYSKSVKEIYQTAGIDFDFSEARIRELVDFVRQELAEVDKL